MIKFSKRICKKFSTLIVPDAGRLTKEVSILYKAAQNFD